MKFFGGLSVDETAQALHVSPDTVKRDWRFAKLWLLAQEARAGGFMSAAAGRMVVVVNWFEELKRLVPAK